MIVITMINIIKFVMVSVNDKPAEAHAQVIWLLVVTAVLSSVALTDALFCTVPQDTDGQVVMFTVYHMCQEPDAAIDVMLNSR